MALCASWASEFGRTIVRRDTHGHTKYYMYSTTTTTGRQAGAPGAAAASEKRGNILAHK